MCGVGQESRAREQVPRCALDDGEADVGDESDEGDARSGVEGGGVAEGGDCAGELLRLLDAVAVAVSVRVAVAVAVECAVGRLWRRR